LEKVKSGYLKQLMGVSKYNKNAYTYRLVEEDLFVHELRQRFDLPETDKNYVNFVANYEATHVNNFNAKFSALLQCEMMFGNNGAKAVLPRK